MTDDQHRDLAARLTATADQLDAAMRDRRAEELRILETRTVPPKERQLQPLDLWMEDDLWCAVLRSEIGILCGYVRLPDGHPWEGVYYDEPVADAPGIDPDAFTQEVVDDHGAIPVFAALFGGEERLESYGRTLAAAVPVHGGLTYTGTLPVAGVPTGWWLGFDCGHAGDAVPWFDEFNPLFTRAMEAFGRLHTWTLDEVKLEVKRIVTAVGAATSHPITGTDHADPPARWYIDRIGVCDRPTVATRQEASMSGIYIPHRPRRGPAPKPGQAR